MPGSTQSNFSLPVITAADRDNLGGLEPVATWIYVWGAKVPLFQVDVGFGCSGDVGCGHFEQSAARRGRWKW
jgi:hypothetical protein